MNKISELLKGKEEEWTAIVDKKRPLQLLDLPVDILKEIVKEVTHTNDLTSLALTHSALHSLVIPHIYSRFDIVWPDAHATTEPRTGVDALTYGLATLVMGEHVFGSTSGPSDDSIGSTTCSKYTDAKPSNDDRIDTLPAVGGQPRRFRRGNYFSKFTRKFSLGNGPPEWVQEYLITKEGGKMLGTLVALAVARMPYLETFIWDMPTGVLRDVWLALSSLGDREECRLEKVWVRWHDNADVQGIRIIPPPPTLQHPPPPLPSNLVTPVGILVQPNGISTAPQDVPLPYSPVPASPAPSSNRTEYPNFSVLPPLKSLSVLDIDELSYLDEMSVLIARSQSRLRELRVGVAPQVKADWMKAWDGVGLQQVDHDSNRPCASRIGQRRLGGVLGVLVGRIYDIRRKRQKMSSKASASPGSQEIAATQTLPLHFSNTGNIPQPLEDGNGSASLDVTTDDQGPAASTDLPVHTGSHDLTTSAIENRDAEQVFDSDPVKKQQPLSSQLSSGESSVHLTSLAPNAGQCLLPNSSQSASGSGPADPSASLNSNCGPEDRPLLKGQLNLETLELERVPLSVSVLTNAFNWSSITQLTILRCENHEQLWKTLRRNFSPKAKHGATPAKLSSFRPFSNASDQSSGSYALNLKKVHTDAVSSALIAFLKDALAPNSLEILFLQDSRSFISNITVESIYRGAVRRHCKSLRKLMIDSSDKKTASHSLASQRGRKWLFNREILNFITSGKMTNLRELGMSLSYKDWHFFLQRLPHLPQLRSLYIPFIADHVHGTKPDPRELALQIVDIVALRPEIEICYIGILSKCFEILENQVHETRSTNRDSSTSPANAGPGGIFPGTGIGASDEEEDEVDDDDDDDDGDDDDDDDEGTVPVGDPDETESDMSSDQQYGSEDDYLFSDDDDDSRPRLRLREILFYDDKVAVFKARHERL
ncbi:MAG: hypothetical protein M1819_002723 [Sarea resinae]|nr:MAG: hypothetical protein M1819_002723 [Sarea resinae]